MKDLVKKVLDKYFDNYSLSEIPVGATQARLFQVTVGNQIPYILKAQRKVNSFESLQNDKRNYEWLNGKIVVPEVIFYELIDNQEFLCRTKQKGKTLDKFIGEISDEEIVKRYANVLRLLHSISLDENAFSNKIDIETKIEIAKSNIENNLVNQDDFETENRNLSVEELFLSLIAKKPLTSEFIFTHGDYCLDNIIFDNNNFNGLIDIGRGGVADKYQDIALAIRTVREIFSKDYSNLFYQEYKLENINKEKIDFYILLDEFF